MAQTTYHQFCPVAMASEILGSRWTIVLLRELIAGSTRFNELRRGVPRMSPALLSKRLKELEANGVLTRQKTRRGQDHVDYVLTEAGQDLAEVVMAIGIWGQRWIESQPSLRRLDASLLMWDMRRNLDSVHLPARPVTIQFILVDQPRARRNWWLLHDPRDGADLCSVDPGFDVDLYVRVDLRTLTAIWMGLDRVAAAVADDRLLLSGDAGLARGMQAWLGLSPFAKHAKRVA